MLLGQKRKQRSLFLPYAPRRPAGGTVTTITTHSSSTNGSEGGGTKISSVYQDMAPPSPTGSSATSGGGGGGGGGGAAFFACTASTPTSTQQQQQQQQQQQGTTTVQVEGGGESGHSCPRRTSPSHSFLPQAITTESKGVHASGYMVGQQSRQGLQDQTAQEDQTQNAPLSSSRSSQAASTHGSLYQSASSHSQGLSGSMNHSNSSSSTAKQGSCGSVPTSACHRRIGGAGDQASQSQRTLKLGQQSTSHKSQRQSSAAGSVSGDFPTLGSTTSGRGAGNEEGGGVELSMTSEKLTSIMQYLNESDEHSRGGRLSQVHPEALLLQQLQQQQQQQQGQELQQQQQEQERKLQQQQQQQQQSAPPVQHQARRALWSPDQSHRHAASLKQMRASNSQSLPPSARTSHTSACGGYPPTQLTSSLQQQGCDQQQQQEQQQVPQPVGRWLQGGQGPEGHHVQLKAQHQPPPSTRSSSAVASCINPTGSQKHPIPAAVPSSPPHAAAAPLQDGGAPGFAGAIRSGSGGGMQDGPRWAVKRSADGEVRGGGGGAAAWAAAGHAPKDPVTSAASTAGTLVPSAVCLQGEGLLPHMQQQQQQQRQQQQQQQEGVGWGVGYARPSSPMRTRSACGARTRAEVSDGRVYECM